MILIINGAIKYIQFQSLKIVSNNINCFHYFSFSLNNEVEKNFLYSVYLVFNLEMIWIIIKNFIEKLKIFI